MTLPNFLVIGAPKAGTTSLHLHLRAHPEVFMPELKEPRFFGYEGEGERLKFPIRTLEEYTALFDAVTDETAIGEATPHYLVYPGAAQRIHDLLPGARLIASLRDPVERSYSVYQMNLRNRGVNDGVPFVEAMRDRPQPARDLCRHAGALLRAVPGRAAQGDPARGPGEGAAGDDARALRLSRRRSRLPAGGSLEGRQSRRRAAQQAPARAFVRPAAPAVQPGVPARRGGRAAQGACAAATSQKQPLAPEDRRAAIGFFRDDILRTQDLIGRDLSSWLHA